MKVNFNFDTGARRIRLRVEDSLEKAVLNEMALLSEKGVTMKIKNVDAAGAGCEFEVEMRINGFEKEKQSE